MNRTALVAVGCIALVILGTFAGEKKGVELGSSIPKFTLEDQTGKEHKLSKHKDKLVVLMFSSQECPWSRGADTEMPALSKAYADKGVVFLAIDSHKDTTRDEISEYVKRAHIPYPVLKDERNLYADKLGAAATPEFYILDKESKLAYHGAFDNRKSPNQTGSTNYVKAALDNLLAGQKVANPEVKAWGCGIKRVGKASGGSSAKKSSGSRYRSSGSGSKY